MSLEDMSLEQRDELALLAKQLADSPATRKDFLRMTKKVKPDLPIPELEIEEHTNSALELMRKENEELRNKMREKDALEELQARRNNLLKKGLVRSEDDIPEVEKIMLEKGITNHESAAEYFEWMKQSAEPTPTGYNPNVMAKFDLSKYYKNAQTAARDEAAKALQELRGNRRPIGV
jgi:hypothetical protein